MKSYKVCVLVMKVVVEIKILVMYDDVRRLNFIYVLCVVFMYFMN